MTRKEFCLEYNITEDQFLGKKVIDHSLNLNSIGNGLTIPEGFNPFINGFLFLENIRIIPEGFNAKISGSLYISNVEYLPRDLLSLPMDGHICRFNPVVGGDIIFKDNIVCGNLICKKSVKESLRLMIHSNDKELQDLAVSELWKYRTVDIKNITQGVKVKFI